MSLSIGQRIGGYELLDYFDSSSSRIAFRARNLENNRIEQLHILPEAMNADPERSARFVRESRIIATLRHPNIVTCHGVVELGGHMAIAVEALEAVTLAERLELGPMEVEEAVRAVLQVMAAVDAAHAAGVLHREISPTNILITPDQMIKLTGFSAAKTAADANVTRAGTLVGNAQYTAPEVFQGYASLDPRIDVYAIGCVFYALVTGRPPFDEKNEYDVMLAHLQREPVAPSQLNRAVNGVLDAVILKALAKHPDGRYQTVREFYHAILNPGEVYVPDPAVVAGAPEEATGPPVAPVPAVVADPGLSPAAIALGAGALLLLIAVWVLLRSGSSGP
jgi:serine/threonine protein kinase